MIGCPVKNKTERTWKEAVVFEFIVILRIIT
jgi:hypothetical protein